MDKENLKRVLTGAFPNSAVTVGKPQDGVEIGSSQYVKYGVYSDPSGRKEFIGVIMERDETSESPPEQLTEDDYVQHSIMRFDFRTDQWLSAPGLMRTVSSTSFHFYDDEDSFVDELLAFRERFHARSPQEPQGSSHDV